MRDAVQFAIMCLLALCISGCVSDAVAVDDAVEKVQTTSQTEPLSDNEAQSYPVENTGALIDLQELGLPLEGANVFDPKKIKIGEKVQSFVLTGIQYWEGKPDYPLDTVSAKFEGKAVLQGELIFVKKDGEFFLNDWLMFKPDERSQEKMPVSHHESRGRPIIFSNQEDVLSNVDIQPGETKSVTLEVKDYIINFLPTDAENVAIFSRVYPEDGAAAQ